LEALNAYVDALLRAGASNDAFSAARAGLDLARSAHDVVYQASFLRRIGTLRAVDDPAGATAMFEESATLCRSIENDFGLALSYHGLVEVHVRSGRIDDAIAAATLASEIRREMGDRRGLVYSLVDRAHVALLSGRTEGIVESLREALGIVRTTENTLGLALAVQATAAWALANGRPEIAAPLAGFADASFAALRVARGALAGALRDRLERDLHAALPQPLLGDLLEAGATFEAHAAQHEADAALAPPA
jgi:hypothetical protein